MRHAGQVTDDTFGVAEITIVTGMSGAGRSRAATVLEDLNWYVVDNLPVGLLHHLVKIVHLPVPGRDRIAAVIDIRSGESFSSLHDVLMDLEKSGIGHRVIFLDADDATLVRRFDSVRRPHPLQGDGRLPDAIETERKILAEARDMADVVIDTSTTSLNELARLVRAAVDSSTQQPELMITVMSFGFKYGIPMDADHVIDMRFISNPFWVPELRELTGEDQAVRDYVLQQHGVLEFITNYVDTIEPTLAGYTAQEKRHLTIAVGCTGGQHRSVAVTERVAALLTERGHQVNTAARDLGRRLEA